MKTNNYLNRFAFVTKYMITKTNETDVLNRFRKGNEIYDKITDNEISVSDSSISIDGVQKITVKMEAQKQLNQINALVVVDKNNEYITNLGDMYNVDAVEFVIESLKNKNVLMSSKMYNIFIGVIRFNITNNLYIYENGVITDLETKKEHTDLNTILGFNDMLLFGGDLLDELKQHIDIVTVVKSMITPLEENVDNKLNLRLNFEKIASCEIGDCSVSGNEVKAFNKMYRNTERQLKNKISDSLIKQLLLRYYLN